MPSISVITICFNNLAELQGTINSVDIQQIVPFEHIIIDGSTNSEIRDYLKSVPLPSYRKWISEPDKGISDAFNKGILTSSGEIIHLLNSGDQYFDSEALDKVNQVFLADKELSWLHGKYIQYRAGMPVVSGKAFDEILLYRGMRQVGHPTMFVKRILYDKHGLYHLEKKIAMDYDFLLRIRKEKFKFTDEVLVKFAAEGVSEKNVNAGLDEVAESYSRLIGPSMKQQFWFTRIRALNRIVKTSLGRMLYRMKNKA